MPIITECPTCDHPAFVTLSRGVVGAWTTHDCGDCGTTMVIEQSRLNGKTYDEAHFVAEILPDHDDIERVDHPDIDDYIYANPDRVVFQDPDE